MLLTNKVYNDYYNYLCDLVKFGDFNGYSALSLKLFQTDFIYLLAMDANRESDGIDIRDTFFYYYKGSSEANNLTDTCSIFELFIGIAKRIDDMVCGSEEETQLNLWFYTLLDNLGLSKYFDGCYDEEAVDKILNDFIFRNYGYDGRGSLFPLKHPQEDVSQKEIYLQMTAFLSENDYRLPKSLGYIK